MKKLNVLHLIPTFGRGGSEKIISQLALEMSTYGYRSMLGIGTVRGLFNLENLGIPWINIPLFPPNSLNFYRSYQVLRKVIRVYQVDLIHSHHRFPNIISQLIGLRYKIPCVVTVHDLASGRRAISRMGLGKHVQVFSRAVKQHLIRHFGVHHTHIHRIPMGIPAVSLLSREEVIKNKKEYGSPATDPIIGFVGRLVSEKGLDYLIEAFPTVLKQNPAAKLWIIGEGELRESLELQAKKLKIGDSVLFLGGQDDVTKFISCFDIALLPSLREGFGLAGLEALAHGKPVIATKVGGLVEIIDDRKTGILVDPANASAIAEAIVFLLHNKGQRTIMGNNALEAVNDRFSFKNMLDGINEFYQEAIYGSVMKY